MSWGLNWFRDQPIYNIRTPLIGKVQKINDIAGEFGGGGHMLAAGATVEADNIQELTNSIIHHLEKRINDGN